MSSSSTAFVPEATNGGRGEPPLPTADWLTPAAAIARVTPMSSRANFFLAVCPLVHPHPPVDSVHLVRLSKVETLALLRRMAMTPGDVRVATTAKEFLFAGRRASTG